VLPEYRRRGLGTRVVREAESWARELGFIRVAVESRDNKIPFYESMGYVPHLDRRIEGETFTCYRMDKDL
jgi:GNAT superfamily N-acetyltransferase